MIEFIDKSPTEQGTPLNRSTLMAIQGFVASETRFNKDGSIVMTNSNGETLSVTFDNNSVRETFQGRFLLVKTTTFENGNIREEIY